MYLAVIQTKRGPQNSLQVNVWDYIKDFDRKVITDPKGVKAMIKSLIEAQNQKFKKSHPMTVELLEDEGDYCLFLYAKGDLRYSIVFYHYHHESETD